MPSTTQSFVIPLWPGAAPGSEDWTQQEQVSVMPEAGLKVIRNVSRPTLTAFLPDPQLANGTAVIVCPGGAFHFLAYEHEGIQVAAWLNARGIAAFMLKYRLIRTSDNFVAEVQERLADRAKMAGPLNALRPLILADAQQAVRLVRQRAAEWGIRPDRIGVMGFSAGGGVTMAVALHHDASCRPDFVAPIYPAHFGEVPVPEDAPPIFLAHASDDALIPPAISIAIYTAWQAAGKPAELHIYSRGGHGFGMNKLGLPVDGWIERFGEWLGAQI
ncbi:MAG: alpha/beta hydrolase [Anaerolineae bacterium]|nr:alpha/beta hydrolase [Anaerolineae bacterium]